MKNKVFFGFMVVALFALSVFAATAHAQDYRTGSTALVSGVSGYPSISESPARVSTSGTTARTATAVPAYSYVRLLCTQDTFFLMGTVAVNAALTDQRLVGNTPEVFNMGASTYVAFIAAGTGSCDVMVLR
jgi:hypothetical protein